MSSFWEKFRSKFPAVLIYEHTGSLFPGSENISDILFFFLGFSPSFLWMLKVGANRFGFISHHTQKLTTSCQLASFAILSADSFHSRHKKVQQASFSFDLTSLSHFRRSNSPVSVPACFARSSFHLPLLSSIASSWARQINCLATLRLPTFAPANRCILLKLLYSIQPRNAGLRDNWFAVPMMMQ